VSAAEVELRVEDDADSAAEACAALLVEASGHVAVTGGSAARVYEHATALRVDWGDVELWWGDERCVASNHEWSNYGLVKRSLLDVVRTPPHPVHRVETELGAAAAAERYDAALTDVRLTTAVLGLGPDGHAASLYPEADTLEERSRRAVTADAKLEPYVERVTMTIPMLETAELALWFVVGAGKAEAARRAFVEAPSRATPASLIRSTRGRNVVVLDREAASVLTT
jgi:6-phosphogluconolactonase